MAISAQGKLDMWNGLRLELHETESRLVLSPPCVRSSPVILALNPPHECVTQLLCVFKSSCNFQVRIYTGCLSWAVKTSGKRSRIAVGTARFYSPRWCAACVAPAKTSCPCVYALNKKPSAHLKNTVLHLRAALKADAEHIACSQRASQPLWIRHKERQKRMSRTWKRKAKRKVSISHLKWAEHTNRIGIPCFLSASRLSVSFFQLALSISQKASKTWAAHIHGYPPNLSHFKHQQCRSDRCSARPHTRLCYY